MEWTNEQLIETARVVAKYENEKAAQLLNELAARFDCALAATRAACAERDALAAENAGLKSGSKFFMHSNDSGFETYKTQEEAIAAAEEMLSIFREEASEGWSEETESICWGIVLQSAVETDVKKPAEENGWLGSCDFKLSPSMETPATDRFLAEVRGQAILSALDECAEHCDTDCIMESLCISYEEAEKRAAGALALYGALREFAQQRRGEKAE